VPVKRLRPEHSAITHWQAGNQCWPCLVLPLPSARPLIGQGPVSQITAVRGGRVIHMAFWLRRRAIAGLFVAIATNVDGAKAADAVQGSVLHMIPLAAGGMIQPYATGSCLMPQHDCIILSIGVRHFSGALTLTYRLISSGYLSEPPGLGLDRAAQLALMRPDDRVVIAVRSTFPWPPHFALAASFSYPATKHRIFACAVCVLSVGLSGQSMD